MLRSFAIIFLLLLGNVVYSQNQRLQALLDSLRIAGNFPGLSIGIVYKDNTSLALVSGYNDKEKGLPLATTDALMQGSVGKTYVSAIALQLVKQEKLVLDKKVADYLGHLPWFSRIP